eukprot:3237762-Alexandrium_andersonii.AAC.1
MHGSEALQIGTFPHSRSVLRIGGLEARKDVCEGRPGVARSGVSGARAPKEGPLRLLCRLKLVGELIVTSFLFSLKGL